MIPDFLKNLLETPTSDKEFLNNQLSSLKPRITQNDDATLREDGNSVDVDEQNVEMVRAQFQYEYMIRLVSSEISRLKYAINEGRG
jgi:flagellar basal-body rod protein FlgB